MFKTLFYQPIYNLLVFFIDILPKNDAGIAVVLVTVVVSLLLFSISKKAIRSQIKLKEIEPEMNRIKSEVKDKQEQAVLMMALYKKHKINPLSLILLFLIQLPILFALYHVFLKGLPVIDTSILYSFIDAPASVNMNFLGILDIGAKSTFLAFITGITQYIQASLAVAKQKKDEVNKDKPKSMQEEFAKSLQMQMKYVFPVIIVVIGMTLPSALTLYWTVRNIFTICQEIVVKKTLK